MILPPPRSIAVPLVLIASAAFFGQSAPRPTPPPTSTASSVPRDSALADLTTFMDRVSRLKDNDVEGRLVLARYARDRQMWSQAAEMANQALYRDPGNRAAYLILQQIDDARPLPPEAEVEENLRTEFKNRFKHEFKTRNSKHFLICYDTTDVYATQRGVTMEKVYDAFQFYFTMGTLRPDFLDKRLVVILFKDHADYLAYGKALEGQDISWSAGFYSQRTNRSTFFDEAGGPSMAAATKEADGLRARIADLDKQILAAATQGQKGLENTLSVERYRARESLKQINFRLGNQADLSNNSKTMHEAAHQISFNMGIQSRLVDYPAWFSEGLACSFEVEDPLGRRGPAQLNFGRIGALKEVVKNGKLMSITNLVAWEPPTADKVDNDTLGIIYCEGWALFHYLYRFHREGLEKYLVAYKTHAALRKIDADERRVIFAKAFGGDLDEMNKKFEAYVKSLPAKPN